MDVDVEEEDEDLVVDVLLEVEDVVLLVEDEVVLVVETAATGTGPVSFIVAAHVASY